MSNDNWRPGGPDPDPFDEIDDEFGAVRFADDEGTGRGAEPRRRGLFDDPVPPAGGTGNTDVWSYLEPPAPQTAGDWAVAVLVDGAEAAKGSFRVVEAK